MEIPKTLPEHLPALFTYAKLRMELHWKICLDRLREREKETQNSANEFSIESSVSLPNLYPQASSIQFSLKHVVISQPKCASLSLMTT